ncbi:DUF5681 domain-containing protein [Ruegeria sp. AU67]|uniref:DUF5681 domain-containing protein n=1 Tax=Ruegeria sp. AU67 TaxID=2108530 RepID=UPI000D6985EA|nr:DUF5681 domain-containing protein [Ruegeria sp. AU67]
MTRNNVGRTYTDETGKFAAGNPGRPKGSRNKYLLAVESLLEDEAEGLARKAIELALKGDTTAMRLCLERIAPPKKDSAVSFDLPLMNSARDAAASAQAVLRAVSQGDVTPLEGAAVMNLVEGFRRVLELSEYEDRINALERAVKLGVT